MWVPWAALPTPRMVVEEVREREEVTSTLQKQERDSHKSCSGTSPCTHFMSRVWPATACEQCNFFFFSLLLSPWSSAPCQVITPQRGTVPTPISGTQGRNFLWGCNTCRSLINKHLYIIRECAFTLRASFELVTQLTCLIYWGWIACIVLYFLGGDEKHIFRRRNSQVQKY